MKLYDFDNTIYRGDASLKFYFYCIKRKPLLVLTIIPLLWGFFMYIIGVYKKTRFKEIFFSFLKKIPDPESIVNDFWEKNQSKLNAFFLETVSAGDYVVSASPEFLLEPIVTKYCNLIASKVDIRTGQFLSKNCRGQEKVRRIMEVSKDCKITHAYGDSKHDLPMLNLAEKPFIVVRGNPIELDQYRPSLSQKLKSQFFERKFLLFLIIGCVNAFNGILFAYLLSFALQANLAFIISYAIALTVSYLLNSFWLFKQKLNLIKYLRFWIGYIPNFVVQNGIVFLLYNTLAWNKIIAFTIACVVAIPITFLCVKIALKIKS